MRGPNHAADMLHAGDVLVDTTSTHHLSMSVFPLLALKMLPSSWMQVLVEPIDNANSECSFGR